MCHMFTTMQTVKCKLALACLNTTSFKRYLLEPQQDALNGELYNFQGREGSIEIADHWYCGIEPMLAQ